MSSKEKLEKRIIQLEKELKEKDKRIERLEKEVEMLTKFIRKYVNENTPSGSLPPYLKPKIDIKEEKNNTKNIKLNVIFVSCCLSYFYQTSISGVAVP